MPYTFDEIPGSTLITYRDAIEMLQTATKLLQAAKGLHYTPIDPTLKSRMVQEALQTVKHAETLIESLAKDTY